MPACQDKNTVEKLVELVRDNPVLYNVSLPEHRDPLFVRNVWSSIAEAMGDRCIDGKCLFFFRPKFNYARCRDLDLDLV